MSSYSEDPGVLEYKVLFQMLALVKESVQACRDYSPLTSRHPQQHLKKNTKKQGSFCFVASCGLYSAGVPLWT